MKGTAERAPGGVPCLLVQAGDDLCAVPIAAVRRVVKALQAYPLPGAGPELLGLAEYGGEPLAVLDLARLVNASSGPKPLYPVTVVVTAGPANSRETVGLAADGAVEIVSIAPASVVPSAGGIVRGEATVGGKVVRLIDLEALGAST